MRWQAPEFNAVSLKQDQGGFPGRRALASAFMSLLRPGWKQLVLASILLAIVHLWVLENIVRPDIIPYTKADQSYALYHSIFLQRSIAEGDFPLWNPYLQYGEPELFQLNPVMLLVHLLSPDGVVDYKIATYLPGLLAGIGAWLFLSLFFQASSSGADTELVRTEYEGNMFYSNHLVLSFLLRFLGALLIMYSPFGLAYLVLPQVLISYAEIPFLLYLAEYLYRNPRSRAGYLGVSLVTGALVLSSFPHTILYGLLATGVYFTGRVFLSKARKALFLPWTLFMGFILLGIGIGIVSLLLFVVVRSQWYPIQTAAYQSPAVYLNGLHLQDLLSYFALNLPDVQSEGGAFSYFNNSFPWLTLGVLIYLRRPSRAHIGIITLILVAVSYFIAFGKFNPAYVWLISNLPNFLRLDNPYRAMLISGTVLPVLAVLGYSSLFARSVEGRRDLPAVAIIAGAFALTVLLTEQYGADNTAGREWIYLIYFVAAMLLALGCLGSVIPNRHFLIGSGLAVLILATPITVRLTLPFYLSEKHTAPTELLEKNPALDYLGPEGSFWRYTTIWNQSQEWIKYAWQDRTTWACLVPDMQLVYKRFGTGNYMTVTNHRGREFNNTAIGTELYEPGSTLAMIRMSAVRWIISEFPLQNLQLVLLGQIEDGEEWAYFYQVPDPLPRAFVPPEVRYLPGKSILPPTNGVDFEPSELAIVDVGETPRAGLAGLQERSGPGQVQIIEYRNQRVELAVHMESPGWVVLSDTFYPGWHASIDGKPADIYQANYLFRAVFVTEGDHHLTFTYFPFELKLGLISMSLCLMAALVLAWASGRILRGRYPIGED